MPRARNERELSLSGRQAAWRGGGLGNTASGWRTDLISWRATLLINLPTGAGVVTAALVLHRRTTEQCSTGRIDFIGAGLATAAFTCAIRSEEHTSELQSRGHLVCRLLLEKKKIIQ